jgi:hypothetical protein
VLARVLCVVLDLAVVVTRRVAPSAATAHRAYGVYSTLTAGAGPGTGPGTAIFRKGERYVCV